MRTHARVVIIGAGIVGCSTAYHLSQMGWSDICVLDRAVSSTRRCSMSAAAKCDLTVTRLGPDRFLVITGGSTGMHDLAWMRSHLTEDGCVQISDMTSSRYCIGVLGTQVARIVAIGLPERFVQSGVSLPHCQIHS